MLSQDAYDGMKMIFTPTLKKEIEENGNHPLIAFAFALDTTFESFELTEEEKTEFAQKVKAELINS